MFVIIGASLFLAIAILTALIATGCPLGEFTMGGQHKILPKKYRIMAVVSVFIQLFAIVIVLQAGGFIGLWFSHKITKNICYFFAVYLSLNTIMNLTSKSNKERFVMSPLAFITAICYWITAIQM